MIAAFQKVSSLFVKGTYQKTDYGKVVSPHNRSSGFRENDQIKERREKIKSRIFFIIFAAANLGLIVYGILALYKPDILLKPFLANVYQFPAEATKATIYLSALYRLLGYLNIIPGMLGLLILYRYRSTHQEWYLKMSVALTTLTYIGPVVFDNTVGTIGFFEVIEHILFMLVIISGFLMLKRPVEAS